MRFPLRESNSTKHLALKTYSNPSSLATPPQQILNGKDTQCIVGLIPSGEFQEFAHLLAVALLDGRQGRMTVSSSVVGKLNKAADEKWLKSMVTIPKDGEVRYMAALEIFHNLHCLVCCHQESNLVEAAKLTLSSQKMLRRLTFFNVQRQLSEEITKKRGHLGERVRSKLGLVNWELISTQIIVSKHCGKRSCATAGRDWSHSIGFMVLKSHTPTTTLSINVEILRAFWIGL
jgi:hypothetical protein